MTLPVVASATPMSMAAGWLRRPHVRSHTPRATSALTGVALAGSSLMAGPAWALPQGGTVVEGDATITYSENSVVIDQNSAHVIIEWDSFDTTAGESVHFDQAAFMAALNRILSGEATRFDGALTGAGSITIVNAAGIAFGADATVDVGAITATTLDILNSNFMADNLVFDQFDCGLRRRERDQRWHDHGCGPGAGCPGRAGRGQQRRDPGAHGRGGPGVGHGGDDRLLWRRADQLRAGLAPPRRHRWTPTATRSTALVDNDGEIYADGGTVILRAEGGGRHRRQRDQHGRRDPGPLGRGPRRPDRAGRRRRRRSDVRVAGTLDASGD